MKLELLNIPKDIVKIGEKAFYVCPQIRDIYAYPTTAIKCDSNIFNSTTYVNATLHIPEESVESYANTEPWCYFSIIEPF